MNVQKLIKYDLEKPRIGCYATNKVHPCFKWTEEHEYYEVLQTLPEYRDTKFYHIAIVDISTPPVLKDWCITSTGELKFINHQHFVKNEARDLYDIQFSLDGCVKVITGTDDIYQNHLPLIDEADFFIVDNIYNEFKKNNKYNVDFVLNDNKYYVNIQEKIKYLILNNSKENMFNINDMIAMYNTGYSDNSIGRENNEGLYNYLNNYESKRS